MLIALLSPAAKGALLPLLAEVNIEPSYYKHLPIMLVVISLVYAATRFDDWGHILHEAVRRMLPKNKLAFKMITKLKIYKGSEHPHQAQQPVPLELATK